MAKACTGPMDTLRVRNQSKSLSQSELDWLLYHVVSCSLLLSKSGENKVNLWTQTNKKVIKESQVLEL